MKQPFPHLGDRETTDYIAPDTVLVSVGTFGDACTLFVGCQNSGSTLAANPVWLTEVRVSKALTTARILMEKTTQKS